jgi:hypothetical protein
MEGETMRNVLIPALLLCVSCTTTTGAGPNDLTDAVVVFLGASITEAFYYPEEGEFFPDYNFYKIIEFGPDKSSVFPDIEALNPDIVTFKECGAYFDEGGDTDLEAMEGFMQDIADFCESIGAVPVPATTLPIDVGHGGHTQAQLDDIIEFDEWVRDWCADNGWECMDYYDWIADADGQLPREYHDGDGLHPNQDGYDELGPHVIPTLEEVELTITSSSFGLIKALFR